MEIKIYSLTLHNFKGVHGTRTFTFNGKNARIEGANGSGKSTIFDSFTWLLFGKDHLGQDWTNFDIKPIDPRTHATVPDLDSVWVEANISVGLRGVTLRRVVTENWVKPRGEAERILKGHTQAFFIDGVACDTKKEYDACIGQWIDEDVFRTITNPLHFIDDKFTDWKARRKTLLALAGYDAGALAKDFPDLIAEMQGRPLEDFRRKLAADKKAQKEEIARANANITAWNAALPEETDTTEVRALIDKKAAVRDAAIAKLRDSIAKADEGIADINKANATYDEAIAEKNAQIRDLRRKMVEYTDRALNAQNEARRGRARAVSEAQAEVTACEESLDMLSRRKGALEQKIRDCTEARADEAARLTELGRRYNALRQEAFTPDVDTVCPTCGRPYDQETVDTQRERLVAEWKENNRKALREIQEKVPGIRAEIAAWEESIRKAQEELEKNAADMKAAREALEHADMALEAAKADTAPEAPDVENSPEYKALQTQVADLNKEVRLYADRRVSTADLFNDRKRFEGEIEEVRSAFEDEVQPLRDAVAVEGERQRILNMIADEEKRRMTLAEELARLERLEVRALEYVKASADSCEDAINALFREARWKMFDRTLDGGLVEMCEVTTKDGIPYRSMNSAARIICGMDVVRALGEANGIKAPIFVDNAESVTRSNFGTDAQVIRLVVAGGKELTVINE